MPTDDGSNGKVIPFPRRSRSETTAAQAEAADQPMERPSLVTRVVELKKRSGAVKTAMNALPAWITPNGVTIFRTLCVIPVIYLIGREAYAVALAVLVGSMLLDFVDGALAEARGLKSELGAFLDPLGDKIVVCGTLIAMMPRLPEFFTVPVMVICLIAIALTLSRIPRMVRRQQGMTEGAVAATAAGKFKTITETVMLILLLGVFTLGLQETNALIVPFATLLIAMALGVLSLFSQLLR